MNTPELIAIFEVAERVGRVAPSGYDRLAVVVRLWVKTADDLPVGWVSRGLVSDRDPGGIAKAGNLAFTVDRQGGGVDDRIAVGVLARGVSAGGTNRSRKHDGGQVDGEFALAIGRGH